MCLRGVLLQQGMEHQQIPLTFSIPLTLKVNHTACRGLISQEFHKEQEREGLIRMCDTGAKGLVN